jgi:hypothetical protein
MLVQGDPKVSVHLMVTIQKVTSNFKSVPRQSTDIYWHAELCSRRPFSVLPSVIPNSNYVITVSDCFLYCNQVHRDFLITLYYCTIAPHSFIHAPPTLYNTNSWRCLWLTHLRKIKSAYSRWRREDLTQVLSNILYKSERSRHFNLCGVYSAFRRPCVVYQRVYTELTCIHFTSCGMCITRLFLCLAITALLMCFVLLPAVISCCLLCHYMCLKILI